MNVSNQQDEDGMEDSQRKSSKVRAFQGHHKEEARAH